MKLIELPTAKSLYIEMYYEDTFLSSGTATLIANNRQSHCTLVTNRHNLTGRHQDTNECLSKMAATPDRINIYFHINQETLGEKWKKVSLPLYKNGKPSWIEHPTLGAKADVVALNLNWGNDVRRFPYYLETKLDNMDLFISPSETVSVIGFPFGRSTNNNLPVWATGFMAQEMTTISKDNPVFMIDCRARPGQSGSPVIAFRTGSYRTFDGEKIRSILTADTNWEFLGIYSGRVNSESDLGRVWHVSTIKELFHAAELKQEESL